MRALSFWMFLMSLTVLSVSCKSKSSGRSPGTEQVSPAQKACVEAAAATDAVGSPVWSGTQCKCSDSDYVWDSSDKECRVDTDSGSSDTSSASSANRAALEALEANADSEAACDTPDAWSDSRNKCYEIESITKSAVCTLVSEFTWSNGECVVKRSSSILSDRINSKSQSSLGSSCPVGQVELYTGCDQKSLVAMMNQFTCTDHEAKGSQVRWDIRTQTCKVTETSLSSTVGIFQQVTERQCTEAQRDGVRVQWDPVLESCDCIGRAGLEYNINTNACEPPLQSSGTLGTQSLGNNNCVTDINTGLCSTNPNLQVTQCPDGHEIAIINGVSTCQKSKSRGLGSILLDTAGQVLQNIAN